MIGRGMSPGVKVADGARVLWLSIGINESCDFLSLRIRKGDP